MSAPLYDPERYLAACRYAAEVHLGQTVPGTELPYILHLQMVCQEVVCALTVEPTGDAELAVLCALLHDSVEDTDATIEDVAARFGDPVAAGVASLTKDPSLPKPERMPDSLRRIRAQPRAVWMVKLADRVTNLQPPPAHWAADKCARYRAEAETILSALGPASAWLSDRMRAKIRGYARHCK